ncbi:MAG TPA: SAF domain-containing protein [Acidimicrobiia bacterium]|nr:SAF domain-containing protein [Acidimicrobiia bacterium]
MASSPSTKLRDAGSSKTSRRRVRRRLSATHVLIAVVVILAFVLNLLVLRDRDSTILVAVADQPLTTGSVLTSDSIRLVPIDSGFEALDHLITEDDLSGLEGWVLNRAIAEGALLDTSDLVPPGESSGLRSMSIPIDRSHAAGGSLVAGDRVDVISVDEGMPAYVATDLEVTGVAEEASGSIGTVSSYHVVLSVTAEQALALSAALDAGSLEIIRATGAEVIDSDATEADDS